MHTAKQLIARALTLIVWPAILYMLFFYIHLEILNHSGNGDGFYSSAFQSRLIGNSLYNASMPRQVAYGAVLTIKNYKTGGGYLHSHHHLYPKGVGSRQQQVYKNTFKRACLILRKLFEFNYGIYEQKNTKNGNKNNNKKNS